MIDDSTFDRSRRNVIVFCVAIIAFILGDGEFSGKLLGMVEINNKEVLYIILIIIFTYMIYRFHILGGKKIHREMLSVFMQQYIAVDNHVFNNATLVHDIDDFDMEFSATGKNATSKKLNKCMHYYRLKFEELNGVKSKRIHITIRKVSLFNASVSIDYGESVSLETSVSIFSIPKLYLNSLFSLLFKEPVTSNYLLPYLLVIAASYLIVIEFIIYLRCQTYLEAYIFYTFH